MVNDFLCWTVLLVEVGFWVILCNRFLTEIDFTLLACVLLGSRGQSVTGEVIAQVKNLSTTLLLWFAFQTGSSHDWLQVIIPDLGGTMEPQWLAQDRDYLGHIYCVKGKKQWVKIALISFNKRSWLVDLFYPVCFTDQATSGRDKTFLLHNTALKLAMLTDAINHVRVC